MGDRRGKANICLYVDPAIKRDFQIYAKKDGRSLTNFITRVLVQYRLAHPLSSKDMELVATVAVNEGEDDE